MGAEAPNDVNTPVIVVGGNYDYPPYDYANEKGEPCGFNVDLTRAIAREVNIPVKFYHGTWREIQDKFIDGEIDILQGMIYTPSRDQIFRLSQPHTDIWTAAFIRKGAPDIKRFNDLQDKAIIAVEGDLVTERLNTIKITEKLRVMYRQNIALYMLSQNDEYDCALMNYISGLYWIEKLQLENITASSLVRKRHYCYAVMPGNEALLDQFQKGLDRVKQTEEYDRLYEKWIGPYQPKQVLLEPLFRYIVLAGISVLLLIAIVLLWSMMLRRMVRIRTRQLQHEVLDHQHTEEALLHEKNTLRTLIDHIPEYIYFKDTESRFTVVNRAMLRLFRVDREDQVLGKTDMDFLAPELARQYYADEQKVFQTGIPLLDHQEHFIDENGNRGWLLSNKIALRDPDGKITGLIGISHNITGHKRTELQLRMSEQCFKAIADYTYFWEIWMSPTGQLLWTNPACERVCGYTVSELRKMKDFPLQIIYEDDKSRMKRALNAALRGTPGNEVQFRLIKKDDTVIWAEISWQTIYDDKNVSQGFRASVRDITDRILAQNEVQTNKERLELALEASNVGLWDWNIKTGQVYFSNKWYTMLGYEPNELPSSYEMWAALLHPDERQQTEDKIHAHIEQKSGSFEEAFRMRTKDGQWRKILSRGKVVERDVQGNPIRMIGTHVDITEQ